MTPEDMANASRLVTCAYNELSADAASLEDAEYRRLMTECIARPKVTFLEMYPGDQDRRRLFDEMVKLGFFNKEDSPDHVWPRGHMNPQTYLTAPSSHNDFYNAHPGGLAVTVAYNIRMADAYTENYRQMYRRADQPRPAGRAALLVHEYPKVWLYQWQEDGSWLEEPRTVYDDTWHAHCIYVTAELMHRRFDSRIVMAMAAAHQLGMLEASMDGRNVVCQLARPRARGAFHQGRGRDGAGRSRRLWAARAQEERQGRAGAGAGGAMGHPSRRHELALRDGRGASLHLADAAAIRPERFRDQGQGVSTAGRSTSSRTMSGRSSARSRSTRSWCGRAGTRR